MLQEILKSSTDPVSRIPLSTSTPIKKNDEKVQPDVCNVSIKLANEPATVVAVSPKVKSKPSSIDSSSNDSPKPIVSKLPSPLFDTKSKNLDKKSSMTPSSPLPRPSHNKSPLMPLKSHIPISKERLQGRTPVGEKLASNSSLDSSITPTEEVHSKLSPPSPKVSKVSEMKKAYGADCDDEVIKFESEALQMMRRMDLMLLTVGGVDNERDPVKRLEVRFSKKLYHYGVFRITNFDFYFRFLRVNLEVWHQMQLN